VDDGLGDPAARARSLAGIAPEHAAEHHALLRRIFEAEAEDRRATGGGEFFENLYHCAFLLYLVGDPADVPMMWRAKHLDFDTACGFDVQFLLGAGSRRTLTYLADNGHEALARALSEHPDLDEDRQEWETFRRGYFYDPPG
jgi:hypothetical protein